MDWLRERREFDLVWAPTCTTGQRGDAACHLAWGYHRKLQGGDNNFLCKQCLYIVCLISAGPIDLTNQSMGHLLERSWSKQVLFII